MIDLAPGWKVQIDRGPNCLFVRLREPSSGRGRDCLPLGEFLWAILEQHFTYRLVLELQDLRHLPSEWLGQFLQLQSRIRSHGGLMRLCGLSEINQQVLQRSRLSGKLPNYANREEAVMPHVPRALQAH